MAHLVDSDVLAGDRMKFVIAEADPILVAMDETAWISRLRSAEMPVSEAVNLFAANRHWMARVLRGCPESDFAYRSAHGARPDDAGRAVTTYVNHLDHHLKFLYAKRANLGVALEPRYTYPTK